MSCPDCFGDGDYSWGFVVGSLGMFLKQNFGSLLSRWWFQTFFIFNPSWGNDPI